MKPKTNMTPGNYDSQLRNPGKSPTEYLPGNRLTLSCMKQWLNLE